MAVYILFIFFPLIFLIHRPKKEVLTAAALIAAFLLLHGGFVTGESSVSWDTLAWSMGLHYVREVANAGNFPGWNVHFNSGEPLYIYHYAYAFWQWFAFIAADYFLQVKPSALFNIFLLSLYVFYNVGCYLVFLKLFKDARVALFSFGVSLFAMSFVVYLQEHSSLYVSIYFPYIIYFLLEYIEEGDRTALFLIPPLFGIAANVYLPHIVLLAAAGFLAAYLVFMERGHFKMTGGRRAALAGASGAVLMLVIMLPVFYVYLKLDGFTSPIKYGFDSLTDTDSFVTGHHQNWESILYLFSVANYTSRRAILFVGMIPLILAGVAVFRSRNRFKWAVLAAAVVLHFLSMGRNSIFLPLLHYIPTFSLVRQFVVFEIFVQFFIICLAGMGLEHIIGLKDPERRATLITAMKVLSVTAVLFASVKYMEMTISEWQLIPWQMDVTFFLLSSASVIMLIRPGGAKAFAFTAIVCALALASFQWHVGVLNFTKFKTTNDADEHKNISEILQRGKGRKFEWQESRLPLHQKLLRVRSYNTFESALYGVELSFSEPVETNLLISKRHYELKALRRYHPEYFGVRHPKIFTTANYEILPAAAVIGEMNNRAQEFVEDRLVFFAEEDVEGRLGMERSGGIRESLSVLDYGPNGLTLTAEVSKAAYLVYLQGFDADWKAYVNGVETRILRVNHNFQAVAMPMGKNTVVFRYESPYGYLLFLYLAGSLTTACVMVYYFIKKRLRLKATPVTS